MRRNLRELVHDGFFLLAPKRLLRRMTSCERVTERISYGENQSTKQRLETAFHVAICQACWLYREQLKRMQAALHARAERNETPLSTKKLEEKIAQWTQEFSKES